MKTTVDLPSDLLIAAKKTAIDRSTTLKALLESGLRRELAQPGPPACGRVARLRLVNSSIWKDADAYVATQRAGWE
ncbi:MAG: hypothetical protein SFU53_05600 [Terrimicrobiaceae bacterium]|nr:hypothetical protein [Terrimicrobiaceae bacterium]